MEKTRAYIIRNNELIAVVSTTAKNGEECIYAREITKERIFANREYNLVNAKSAKISRAKKWDKEIERAGGFSVATEINDLEFYVE